MKQAVRANVLSPRWIVSLPKPLRDRVAREQRARDIILLDGDWYFERARDSQIPPLGDWRTWLLLAGRGFGKTRTGAEFVRSRVEAGLARRVALVAPTAADVRQVMVEGESGILAVCSERSQPLYEPSKHRLTWPGA